jgi:hypothetical protein
MTMPAISPGLVLVTGGSGYFAGFCIASGPPKDYAISVTRSGLDPTIAASSCFETTMVTPPAVEVPYSLSLSSARTKR